MPTPYAPGSGSENPSFAAFAREKLVRNLDQDARAVARFPDRSRRRRDASD